VFVVKIEKESFSVWLELLKRDVRFQQGTIVLLILYQLIE